MRSVVLFVPRRSAETVRRSLRASGVLRAGVPVLREGERVGFAVERAPAEMPDGGVLEERELDAPGPRPPRSYRDLLHLPRDRQRRLPRAFDVVGDVVLVRLPAELADDAPAVGAALLAFVPGARKVGWDRGVHGGARLRELVEIAGSGPWRTVHRENGLSLVVDPETAYFSPRLAREHADVAGRVGSGELVWDLCCGVGPFSLAIAHAGRARRIVAVDSNPAAVALLRENADRLGLSGRIEARCEPVERFVRSGTAPERAILNLPREGIKYAPSVSAAVAPGGRFHYYEVTPRAEVSMRGSGILGTLSPPLEWELEEQHRVHPYSPAADLVAYTFRRRG